MKTWSNNFSGRTFLFSPKNFLWKDCLLKNSSGILGRKASVVTTELTRLRFLWWTAMLPFLYSRTLEDKQLTGILTVLKLWGAILQHEELLFFNLEAVPHWKVLPSRQNECIRSEINCFFFLILLSFEACWGSTYTYNVYTYIMSS